NGRDAQYLFTLAHELAHAYHFVNGIGSTESACDALAEQCLRRYREPVCDPYEEFIDGAPHVCECGRLAFAARCELCEAEFRRRRDANYQRCFEERAARVRRKQAIQEHLKRAEAAAVQRQLDHAK